MRRFSLLLLFFVTLGLPAGATVAGATVAGANHDSDHKELTELRITTQKAINGSNFDILKPYLVEDNLTVITVDGKKCVSLNEFSEYWNKLLQSKEYGLDKIEVNPVADGPTEFLADNIGICHGTSTDRYFFKNGDVRTMPERWTAVVLKEDGKWKISRILFSANILDNPVIKAIEQESVKLAVITGIGGAVFGAVLAWLVCRPKKS